jgi:16S rRNA G966 N2-methylase RsmD
MGSGGSAYDRQRLLLGEKRNAVLELWEVERYGTDSYGDPDYVSVYGMRPADWYARGIRLLGRTAVECTRDDLGDAIAQDVAGVAARASGTAGSLVVDLFAGSGNTLHWLLRRLPGARGLGFEVDARVFELTQRNLAALSLPLDVVPTDYAAGLNALRVPADQLVVAFIAPPWGEALSATSGLDLRRTTPPVTDIVDVLAARFAMNRLLCAIQVPETVDPASMSQLATRFDWTTRRTYALNAHGQNHGVVLGTRGWTP